MSFLGRIREVREKARVEVQRGREAWQQYSEAWHERVALGHPWAYRSDEEAAPFREADARLQEAKDRVPGWAFWLSREGDDG